MDPVFLLTVFTALFAIINPLGNVPFFVAVTEGMERWEKKAIARRTAVVSVVVLTVFTLVGSYVFALFGIGVASLRIAGGILVFKVGFDMMHGKRSETRRTDAEHAEAIERQAVGIVPLGVPLHAGPGAISTVMLLATENGAGWYTEAVTIAMSVVVMAIAYVLLVNGDRIFARMGRIGTLAFSRIMGLIIAAIAVEFFFDGLTEMVDRIHDALSVDATTR